MRQAATGLTVLEMSMTIGTNLRTLQTLPCLIGAAASGNKFAACLCEAQLVVQAYIGRATACASPAGGKKRVAWDVLRGYRAIRKVACFAVTHVDVLLG